MRITIEGGAALQRTLDAMGEATRGRALERATIAAALIVQNDAKRRVPVLTGNLRRSIHIGGHEDLAPGFGAEQTTGPEVPAPRHFDNENRVEVYVGTNVEYAMAIEYGVDEGNLHRPARPYLRPALDENTAAVEREFGESLRDLLAHAT